MDHVNHSRTPKLWAIAHENVPKMQKMTSLWSRLSKNVLSVMGLVNHSGTPKLLAIAHENSHKRKNDVFVVIPLKILLSVRDIETTPEPQNYGQELMKMALKCKNNEFLVMPLKNVLSIMGLVNHPRTQKM
jgi:hypothetical protein